MRVDVDRLWVLLRAVFLHAKGLAVVVLVLKDVRVLLSLQPHVLEVEENGLATRAAFEHSLHLLSVLEVPGVSVGAWRTPLLVSVGLPLGVRKVLEIMVNYHLIVLLLLYLSNGALGQGLSFLVVIIAPMGVSMGNKKHNKLGMLRIKVD